MRERVVIGNQRISFWLTCQWCRREFRVTGFYRRQKFCTRSCCLKSSRAAEGR